MARAPAPVAGAASARSLIVLAIAVAALSVATAVVAILTPRGSPAGVALVVTAAPDDPTPSDTAPRSTAVPSQALAEAANVLRRRLNELGVESSVFVTSAPPSETITIELRAIGNVGRLEGVLLNPARLEMRLVVGGPVSDQAALLPSSQELPPGRALVSGAAAGDPTPMWYLLDSSVLSGGDMKGARPITDEFGQPAVGFTLTAVGAAKFHELTKANVGRQLAIVVANRVMSTPVIEAPIAGPEGRITGRFTYEEAADLALVLRAGELPVPLRVIEQRALAVIPGRPALRLAAGALSGVLAIAAVSLMAVFLARRAGRA